MALPNFLAKLALIIAKSFVYPCLNFALYVNSAIELINGNFEKFRKYRLIA